MENILNIDKAIEIAQKHHVIYDDYYDSIQECIESCREAMEWKDERHQQEKQQWLDKACEWWTNNWRKYVMTDRNGIVALNFWKNDFKKAMEEEI